MSEVDQSIKVKIVCSFIFSHNFVISILFLNQHNFII